MTLYFGPGHLFSTALYIDSTLTQHFNIRTHVLSCSH